MLVKQGFSVRSYWTCYSWFAFGRLQVEPSIKDGGKK